MKKNLISIAVAASVLGGAAVQAQQYVNPDKTGQVLMFPFYNADNGNATNFHIVNTTAEAKALKVRFVEYKNSDEVLDFNLYLSPADHFAFGVIKNPNGAGGAVITADNSCTVPALGSANPPFDGTATVNATGSTTRIQPFVNYQYANSLDVDSTIDRSLMGHVEVIEMGVLNNVVDTTASAAANAKTAYASMAKHGATGVPANCAGLAAAWVGAAENTDAFETGGVTAPKGGIYGLAYHINVESAAAFGFEPTAIDAWSVSANHSDPGNLSPSLADGADTAVVHNPGVSPYHISKDAGGGAQATSATIMTSSIANDVMVNPAIGGMTDWVISFPTKRLHVDKAASAIVAPFTDNWTGSVTLASGTKVEDKACEPVSIRQWDREELTSGPGLGFSPQPADSVSSICNEVAVVAMGAAGTASALNVTTGLTNLSASYAEGWQRISFGLSNKATANSANTIQKMAFGDKTLTGLPVIGFGAYKVSNGAMSYGNASEHKTAVSIS